MTTPPRHTPSRSDRLRPAEFLGLSGAMALFVGFAVLLTTRQLPLAVISLGITFIVVLVVIALFALGSKPDEAEKSDLDEQNRS